MSTDLLLKGVVLKRRQKITALRVPLGEGYKLEHNYGHGKINLSVNFALLMILAFFVEQIQQLACPLFNATWKKEGSKKQMSEHIRALFFTLNINSMEQIYKALLYGFKILDFVIKLRYIFFI